MLGDKVERRTREFLSRITNEWLSIPKSLLVSASLASLANEHYANNHGRDTKVQDDWARSFRVDARA
jgi:hypothetical protein